MLSSLCISVGNCFDILAYFLRIFEHLNLGKVFFYKNAV